MKLFKYLYKTIFYLILLFFFLHTVIFIYTKITPKLDIKNANNIFIYDKNNDLFFQGNGLNEWISLKKMSPHIINSTISVEDKNFYHHFGFDYLRIIKSLYENFKSQKIVQGASTITQQYAKNLFLNFDKTWQRKLNEVRLTFEIETHYTKNEILEGYLNTINYGNGVLGIENAAQYYFDKSASNLSLAEASMLAGIPKSPNNFSPLNDELEAKKRQKVILNSMVKNKYITEEEKNNIFNKELVYIGKKDKLNLDTLMYYQDAVMREIKEIEYIPTSLLKTKGIKIYTSLDINAQSILEESINNNLKNNQDIQVAAAMIKPKTGEIIALTGGRDFIKSQFNRAIQSKRQVGSTMKPFLYYTALENGFTASSSFISEPTVFTFSNDKTYAPNNYADIYPSKSISMAAALAFSDNIFAIKTHLFLGEQSLVDITKRVGIKENIKPHPSLPLGTEEINIIDLLTGYNTLANEGKKTNLHLIKKIEDMKGNILYKNPNNIQTVLNKNITFIINDLLTTTYDSNMIDYNYPTCISIAPKISKKYAIKTGSTDFDTWTIGYNKDVLIGIWNGYDEGKKLQSGESKYSKNIWVDTIEKFLKDKEDNWYEIPSNVVGVLVNPITGEFANKKNEKKRILYYIKGTEPLLR